MPRRVFCPPGRSFVRTITGNRKGLRSYPRLPLGPVFPVSRVPVDCPQSSMPLPKNPGNTLVSPPKQG